MMIIMIINYMSVIFLIETNRKQKTIQKCFIIEKISFIFDDGYWNNFSKFDKDLLQQQVLPKTIIIQRLQRTKDKDLDQDDTEDFCRIRIDETTSFVWNISWWQF